MVLSPSFATIEHLQSRSAERQRSFKSLRSSAFAQVASVRQAAQSHAIRTFASLAPDRLGESQPYGRAKTDEGRESRCGLFWLTVFIGCLLTEKWLDPFLRNLQPEPGCVARGDPAVLRYRRPGETG